MAFWEVRANSYNKRDYRAGESTKRCYFKIKAKPIKILRMSAT